jgi:hypothetical protein
MKNGMATATIRMTMFKATKIASPINSFLTIKLMLEQNPPRG